MAVQPVKYFLIDIRLSIPNFAKNNHDSLSILIRHISQDGAKNGRHSSPRDPHIHNSSSPVAEHLKMPGYP